MAGIEAPIPMSPFLFSVNRGPSSPCPQSPRSLSSTLRPLLRTRYELCTQLNAQFGVHPGLADSLNLGTNRELNIYIAAPF